MDGAKVNVGNANFKEWLRLQDANTRVDRISSIAISLRKMNLRGSEIKAALGQLSQMCQVMLVRLTAKQIKHFTRRNPLQSLPHQAISESNERESSSIVRKRDSKDSLSSSRKKQKKEELMKELFGEDDCEEATTYSHKNLYDIVVNNRLSNNVNYSLSASSTTNLKRNISSGNSNENSLEIPPKKPKTITYSSKVCDLGISEKPLTISSVSTEGPILDELHDSDSTNSDYRNSKRKDASNKKKKLKKDKQRMLKPVLSVSNAGISEEDPSIKELWSILGMESPTDRTAKYLSDHFNSKSLEAVTIHTSSKSADLNGDSESVPSLSCNSHFSNTTQYVANHTVTVDPLQERTPEETEEPFLRISEPFSLADLNNGEHDHQNTSTTFEENINQEIPVRVKNNVSSNQSCEENINQEIQIGVENNVSSNQSCEDITKSPEPKSKVGTIRVKKLGLLVDPQSTSNLLMETAFTSKNTVSLGATELSMEDRFVATYIHYFDELVEAKIPKLGELLHLALADAMRYFKTVKKTEQLSSQELVKEERLRAKKDFDDKMRSRGVAFSSLCETIVKRFDINSKRTLFLALFYRIFQHAGTIDPVNTESIVAATQVTRSMLKSHQFKDNAIMELLDMLPKQFEDQIRCVEKLVEKCIPKISDKSKPPPSVISNSTASMASNNGRPSTMPSVRLPVDISKPPPSVISNSTAPMASNNGRPSTMPSVRLPVDISKPTPSVISHSTASMASNNGRPSTMTSVRLPVDISKPPPSVISNSTAFMTSNNGRSSTMPSVRLPVDISKPPPSVISNSTASMASNNGRPSTMPSVRLPVDISKPPPSVINHSTASLVTGIIQTPIRPQSTAIPSAGAIIQSRTIRHPITTVGSNYLQPAFTSAKRQPQTSTNLVCTPISQALSSMFSQLAYGNRTQVSAATKNPSLERLLLLPVSTTTLSRGITSNGSTLAPLNSNCTTTNSTKSTYLRNLESSLQNMIDRKQLTNHPQRNVVSHSSLPQQHIVKQITPVTTQTITNVVDILISHNVGSNSQQVSVQNAQCSSTNDSTSRINGELSTTRDATSRNNGELSTTRDATSRNSGDSSVVDTLISHKNNSVGINGQQIFVQNAHCSSANYSTSRINGETSTTRDASSWNNGELSATRDAASRNNGDISVVDTLISRKNNCVGINGQWIFVHGKKIFVQNSQCSSRNYSTSRIIGEISTTRDATSRNNGELSTNRDATSRNNREISTTLVATSRNNGELSTTRDATSRNNGEISAARGPHPHPIMSLSVTTSHVSPAPKIRSPPAEANLPSSSHCHPFIARRPISGKMKMLFGNNSNN